jgi:hypothetical protein
MSPICIFQGVPPRMWPTLRSCSISPATAEETQTTAATPRTAATPSTPFTPTTTIVSAATIVVARVRPDTGLLEDPMRPTRFPDTAAKKNPVMSMTMAAKSAPVRVPVK